MDEQKEGGIANVPRTNIKIEVWIELFVVTMIGVFPDIYRALTMIAYPVFYEIQIPPSYYISFLLVRSVTVSIPILYIIWKNTLSFSNVGLSKFSVRSDIPLGIGIFILTYIFFAILSILTSSIIEIGARYTEEAIKTFFHKPETLTGMVFLFLACIMNGFAEELVMRGYFVERFEFLLGSTPKSVLFSSILFCSYHIYQGALGTFQVFIFGVIYSMLYCKYRRIWPLAVAHSLQNIVNFGFMPK